MLMRYLALSGLALACHVWAGGTNPIGDGEEMILKLKAGVKRRLDDLGAGVTDETLFEPATRETNSDE